MEHDERHCYHLVFHGALMCCRAEVDKCCAHVLIEHPDVEREEKTHGIHPNRWAWMQTEARRRISEATPVAETYPR